MLKSTLYSILLFVLLYFLPSFLFNLLKWHSKNLFLVIFLFNILTICYFYFLDPKKSKNYSLEFKLNGKMLFVGMLIGFFAKILLDPVFNFDIIFGLVNLNDLSTANESFFGIRPLLAIFIVPITEEILYRQIVLTKFFQFSNGKKIFSIFLASLLFASIHSYSLNLFVYTFCLGILLSMIYLKSKNLFIPIIVHLVTNLIAIGFQGANRDLYYNLLSYLDFGLFYWLIVFIGLFFLAIVLKKYVLITK